MGRRLAGPGRSFGETSRRAWTLRTCGGSRRGARPLPSGHGEGPGPIVGQDYDKIVLGWTEGTAGRRALEAAAEEAAPRGSLLSIVTIPATVTPPSTLPSERINVEQALIDSIRRIESTYPGLQIDVTHRSGHVDTELEQSLDRAALLVLGSHHSEQSWSIGVGPIAEELMRRSPCPVMLVGQRSGQHGS